MSLRRAPLLALVSLLACGADALVSTGTCNGAQTLAVGGSATGALGVDDCKSPEGESADLYQITLSAQTNFQMTLTPSGFEPWMMMYSGTATSTNPPLVLDMDGSSPLVAKAFLPAGTYTLAVGTANNKPGSYTLQTETTVNTGCVINSWTVVGITLNGTVTPTDCAGAADSRHDLYAFVGKKGQGITVTATMNKPGDVNLAQRTGGDVAHQHVDPPAGGNFSLFALLPADGVYVIDISSVSAANGNAVYTLAIR